MALSWTMDKVGPICRTVEDCAVVLNAIYGPDGRDETVVDAPFNWSPEQPLAALRIGYVKAELEPQPPTNAANMTEDRLKQFEAQRQILADALGVFKKMGATLEPAEFPTDVPVNAVGFILDAEGAAAFDDLTRTKGIDQLTAQGAGDWPNTFRTSRFIPAVEYIRAQRVRTLLIRKYEALMEKYDVIVSTTRSGSLSATNLTGHPAMCMKMGFVNGLPQALMLTGRLYGEATMLRVALAYEQATKWHTINPTV
jgi:Asp-tRNA(Asn)/Glu-tRNA(Gln) amidotransferase A subunit family amidase